MKAVQIAIVVLLIVIIMFLMFGCMSSTPVVEESFEDYAEEFTVGDEDNENLTTKEKELFQDLKENKLSTEEITDLVKGGVLTEKLVEKFLAELNAHVDDGVGGAKASVPTVDTFTPDDTGIEGFTSGGGQYAQTL